VDHIVAVGLWENKLRTLPDALPTINGEPEGLQIDDLRPIVNELGNCMLLEKNFNISKSNRTLKSFLEVVHEFKDEGLLLSDWAAALDLDMRQVNSDATPVEVLQNLFSARSQKIRSELEKFIRGTSNRIDDAG
jgi:hypothetical protein